MESTEATETIEPPKTWQPENISQWLFTHIEDLNPGKKISLSDDLFEHGFDRYVILFWVVAEACILISALVLQFDGYDSSTPNYWRPSVSKNIWKRIGSKIDQPEYIIHIPNR